MPQPNLGFTSLAQCESAAKFLPSYLSNSPSGSAVCLWQRQWEILAVGSTECGHLLQSASTPPAPPIDTRGTIPTSSFSYPLRTFYPVIPVYLLIPFASPLLWQQAPHLVKLFFIYLKLISYRPHWDPHSSNILLSGKQQLCIPFIQSWRQWIKPWPYPGAHISLPHRLQTANLQPFWSLHLGQLLPPQARFTPLCSSGAVDTRPACCTQGVVNSCKAVPWSLCRQIHIEFGRSVFRCSILLQAQL